jgi:dihydroflavonol-4-reductase
MYAVNIEGTRNILQAALVAGVRRVVYTSSSSTLGSATEGVPVDESGQWVDPGSAYARSKWRAEQVAVDFHRRGLAVVLVNPTYLLGEGGRELSTRRVVSRVLSGEQLGYVTGGVCPVDVADVAAGHLLAAEHGLPGDRYILGGTNVSWGEFFALLATVAGISPPKRVPVGVAFGAAAVIETAASIAKKPPAQSVDEVRVARLFRFYDSRKAERELGYRSRSLVETLERTVDWLRARDGAPPREGSSAPARVVTLAHDTTGQSVRAGDGTHLHLRRWLPRRAPRATLLFLHGIASHGGWFTETADHLVEHDIAVAAVDRRGSGASEGPRGHLDRYEAAIGDLRAAVAHLEAEGPAAPFFLAASSWAAKLAVVHAAQAGDLAGLILLGPGLTPVVDLSLDERLSVLRSRVGAGSHRIAIPLPAPLYTDDAAYQEAIRRDPLRLLTATTSFFWETARLDRKRGEASARLRLPLLVMIGGADVMMDVDATRQWFSSVPSPDKTFRSYPGLGHTLDFAPDPSEYRDDLVGWIHGHSSPPASARTAATREMAGT